MTITGQSSLSKEEIDRMVKDAEAHAADDRRRREEAEVRNNADSLVYQTEKMLKDQASAVTGSEKDQVEAGLAKLKDTLAGSDIDAIRAATEALAASVQELGKRIYEQAAAAGAGPSTAASNGSGGQSSADDEVVDAEIVDGGETR